MLELYIVRKTVQDVDWKVQQITECDNKKLIPASLPIPAGAGKDTYPYKIFPAFDEANKWIEDDKELFIKQYLTDYDIIHTNKIITKTEFYAEVGPMDWVGPEYYWFKCRPESKVEDYLYYPASYAELTIRSKEPNNFHIYKPYGQYQGQQCFYYLERTYVDKNGYGGERRHCVLNCS